MKARHYFAALLLAFGMGQHAYSQEPAKPQQETQQEAASITAQKPAEASPAMQDKAPVATDAANAVAPANAPAASTGRAANTSPASDTPAMNFSTQIAAAPPAVEDRASSFISDVKITDLLITVFAGLLVLLAWVQARRMREAVHAATASATTAERSARVAEDALISGQRAFMFIREIKTILHQDPESGNYQWSIHPIWANSGNTPTRGLSINTSYRLLDAPLPKDYDFPESREDLIPTIAGPKSMVEAAPGAISSEDLQAVQEGKKFFYIWGWAEYHDIFEGTKKRVTRFCNQLVQVDGDPTMPANEHNPVQMMFGFHAENNYAD